MRKELSGQVVIVTGASSGIGRETALHFAREQARVVLAARREQHLQILEKEIQELGAEVLSLATDVAQRDQVEAMVHRVLDRFGRVDILVNNAGSGLFALVEETTPEDMEAILQVNFFGAFYGIRAVLPILRRQRSGHIINIASIVGKRGVPLYGAYCASKFALVGLSESLRLELQGSGIAVSVICPVGTATEFFDAAKNPRGQKQGPKPPVQTAATVAKAIIGCAKSPRPEVIVFPPARLLVVLNALSPRLGDWVIGNMVSRKG
ncbi:MAG: SDR family oxidoreductase [Candidatus Methylomirabilales bacterium]